MGSLVTARMSARAFSTRIVFLAAIPTVMAVVAVVVIGDRSYLQLNRDYPGELTSMLSALFRTSVDISSVVCIGGLFFAAFLRARRGRNRALVISSELGVVRISAVVWGLSSLALIPIDAADGNGVSVARLATPGALGYLASAIYLPAAWIVTTLLVLIIFCAANFVSSWPATMLLLGLGSVAALAPIVVGQILVGPNHDFGGDAGILGTTALTMWFGSTAILVWRLSRGQRVSRTTLKRYGALSVGALTVGAAAEVVLAVFKTDGTPLFANATGYLICADAAVLLAWAFLGVAYSRSYRRGDAADSGHYLAVAWTALALIAVWIGLSVVMTRVPPAQYFVPTSISQLFLGYDITRVPTLLVLFVTGWRINILFAVMSAVGIGFYLAGVRRLHRRGDFWPRGRTAAWVCGWLVIFVTTSSGLGAYAGARFSLHMILHMSLNMFAPVLLVLGGAMTLALRATHPVGPGEPAGPHEWITSVMHWPGVRPFFNPVLVFLVFVGSYYVLYFTDVFDQAMRFHWAHQLMNLHFIGIGYLFYGLVIGVDRPQRPLPSLAKLGVVFAAMPFHAFFGVIVMTSSTVIASTFYQYLDPPWMGSLKADQYVGGGIAWAAGEIPLILVVLALVIQWSRQDKRAAARKDRHLDSGMDASYDAYNDMLAQLANRRPVIHGTGPTDET
jgi:putative copper resistance protein D